jgi:hypothetical protein
MDLLSSLGLTSSTPDPAAFLNQKEVSGQLDMAKTAASSTLTGINFAIDSAKSAGISSNYISVLESLKEKAQTLTDATNKTPAQIEADRVKVEQELAKAKAEQDAATRQNELKAVQEAVTAIAAERTLVETNTTFPADLKTSVQALDTSAKASLAAVQKAIAAKEDLPSTVETGASLSASLKDLQARRTDIENNTSTGGVRALQTGIRWVALGIMILTLVASALLGGSIIANAYITEVFWGIRLYYFIYGALGFPLSLLYGAIRPPVWQAGLLPWSGEESPQVILGNVPRSTMSKLFSYRIFRQNEVDKAGEASLEQSKSLLRWSSVAAIVSSILSILGYVWIVA